MIFYFFLIIYLSVISYLICRKNYRASVVIIPFSIISYTFCWSFTGINIFGFNIANGTFGFNADYFLDSSFYGLVYALFLLFGYFCVYSFGQVNSFLYKNPLNKNNIFAFKVLWVIILAYSTVRFGLRFGSEVKVYSRGGGISYVVGYLSFFVPIVYSLFLRSIDANFKFFLVAVASFPSFLFFFSSGQRGGAVYPFVLALILLYGVPKRSSFKFFAYFAAPFCFFVANRVTDFLRKQFFGKFNPESFDIFSFKIPLSFAHGEMLAAVLGDQLRLSVETFVNSIINWIPSFLLDKGLTAGPEMAIYFFYEVSRLWHSTSLTTGPVVESALYLGYFGVFFGFFHGATIALVAKYIKSFPLRVSFLWLLCFQFFFDDFGGVVNKFILLCVSYGFLIYFLQIFSFNKLKLITYK